MAARRPVSLSAALVAALAALLTLAGCSLGGHSAPSGGPTGAPAPAPPTGTFTPAPFPPAGSYEVGPGHRFTSVQAAVDAAPAGATIAIFDGDYRETVRVKQGQTLLGQSQRARITGANLVEPSWWVRSGDRWYYDDPWPMRGDHSPFGKGMDTTVRTGLADQVLRDGVPLTSRTSPDHLGPDDSYVDEKTHRVWVGGDPAGHTMERSVRQTVVTWADLSATDVTLQNLSLDASATFLQEAGVELGKGWTVKDCRLVGHHGRAIDTTVDNTIIGTVAPYTGEPYSGGTTSSQTGRPGSMVIAHTGGTGIGGYRKGPPWPDDKGNTDPTSDGYSANLRIVNTEVAYGNEALNPFVDEGGGIKFTLQRDVVIDGAYVHDNHGIGIWFDSANRDITIRNSLVTDNVGGIDMEANPGSLTGSARVTGNTLLRNGASRWSDIRPGTKTGGLNGGFHSAVFISASEDTQVDHNFVVMSPSGGYGIVGKSDARGTLAGTSVHDNTVVCTVDTLALGVKDTSGDPHFDDNTVLLDGVAPDRDIYAYGSTMDLRSWQRHAAGDRAIEEPSATATAGTG